MIHVQIIYALPEEPIIIDLCVKHSTNVEDAIIQSHILQQHHLSLEQIQVGVYGKLVELSHPLKDNDRIEIYRPLINDPKEIRRNRAVRQHKKR